MPVSVIVPRPLLSDSFALLKSAVARKSVADDIGNVTAVATSQGTLLTITFCGTLPAS